MGKKDSTEIDGEGLISTRTTVILVISAAIGLLTLLGATTANLEAGQSLTTTLLIATPAGAIASLTAAAALHALVRLN